MSLQSVTARMAQLAATMPTAGRAPAPASRHHSGDSTDFARLLETASAAQEPDRAHHAVRQPPPSPSWRSVGQQLGLRPERPGSGWSAALPAAGRPFAGAIESAAREAGVDPALLGALVWTESGFRADAVSHAGARGLTQLMPGTAAELGVDPGDPGQNLAGGARYLAAQLARFGRADHALAAYNAGPGRVAAAGGIPDIAETRTYVQRVLERWSLLAEGTTGPQDAAGHHRTDAVIHPIHGE